MTEINVKIDVFDDPEYCQGIYVKNGACDYLSPLKGWYCKFFNIGLQVDDRNTDSKGLFKKCLQCKTAYLEAKEKGL